MTIDMQLREIPSCFVNCHLTANENPYAIWLVETLQRGITCKPLQCKRLLSNLSDKTLHFPKTRLNATFWGNKSSFVT